MVAKLLVSLRKTEGQLPPRVEDISDLRKRAECGDWPREFWLINMTLEEIKQDIEKSTDTATDVPRMRKLRKRPFMTHNRLQSSVSANFLREVK